MATANKSILKVVKFVSFAASLTILSPNISFAEDTQQAVSEQGFIEDQKQSYGPIVKSDTLWKIAVAHRPDTTVSNYQVMMSLFENNPNAFLRNDINTMVTGQYLRIPTLEEIRKVAPYPYQPINKTNTANSLNQPVEEPILVIDESIAVPEGQQATEMAVNISVEQNVDTTIADNRLQVQNAETSVPNSALPIDANDNPATEIAEVSSTPVEQTPVLSNLEAENTELKESLSAVDDQLSYLQYEVAKANEYQVKMDDKLSEQNKLLTEAKQREQRLLVQQRKLSEQQQGFFNNPLSYWSINALLAILVTVLFILVYRRRQVEKTLKAQIEANATTTKKDDNKIDKTVVASNTNNQHLEKIKEPNVITPSTEDEYVADIVDKRNPQEEINTDNSNVINAFTSIDLSPVNHDVASEEPLSENDLLTNLVIKSEPSITEQDTSEETGTSALTPAQNKQNPNDSETIAISANKDDLNIDQIIDDMLDEDSKPAKLRSARAPLDNLVTAEGETSGVTARQKQDEVVEFNDFDDVEFDKLLEEISVESQSLPTKSNVTQLRRTTEIVEPKPVVDKNVNNEQQSANEAQPIKEQEYISVNELIEESEAAAALDETILDDHQIDVGLDEFPEFASKINHVNVDDDKHGVNAKLDLAQVYIEIGDIDNASVILKSVMKLGNSAQQQQAQQLLYSIK